MVPSIGNTMETMEKTELIQIMISTFIDIMESRSEVQPRDTTIGRVREILRRFPKARDTDAYLTWLYLKNYEAVKLPFLEFQKFNELHFETIRRARQKIQRKGDYLPLDAEVRKQRGKEWMNRGKKRETASIE